MRRFQLEGTDKADFERLKKVVHAGFKTFVEVGTALMEIRERGLYKGDCSTFEAWVQIEFGLSRSRAYQQIAAAETVALLSTTVDTVPESEWVARPLTGHPPEQQQDAWAGAVEGSDGKPTAEDVKVAVQAAHVSDDHVEIAAAVRKAKRNRERKKAEARTAPEADTSTIPPEGDAVATEAGEIPAGASTFENEGPEEVEEEGTGRDFRDVSPDTRTTDQDSEPIGSVPITEESSPGALSPLANEIREVLTLLPVYLPQPTNAALDALTADDRARLIAFSRWAQMVAVAYDRRHPAHFAGVPA